MIVMAVELVYAAAGAERTPFATTLGVLVMRLTPLPLRAESLGAGEIVLNVMNADGTRAGYDLEMTAAVSEAVKVPVVASGGAGEPKHLLDVLTAGKADAALAASIFHFGTYTVGQVKHFLAEHGVPMRLV